MAPNSIVIRSIFILRKKNFNINLIPKAFSDIKPLSVNSMKLILMLLVLILINLYSYIYFGLRARTNYGVTLLLRVFILLLIWAMCLLKMAIILIGHSLPLGVRGVLKIFIPFIETLGMTIRPMTLAIRLATNISCGHVVLLILRYLLVSNNFVTPIGVTVLLIILFLIEFLVCVTQAYVFRSLLYVYYIDCET